VSEIVVRFAGHATANRGAIVARIGTVHAPSCPAWLQARKACTCGAEELWAQLVGANGADPWAAISRWAANSAS
jgi:hypothetical protein